MPPPLDPPLRVSNGKSESWMEGGSKRWKVEIDRSTWYQDRSQTTRTHRLPKTNDLK